MQTDDDSQTTLSKWPFILGDILLVATALAIAILGNWQLTDWQVAACVIAVALGAALFVLPYVVEFQVRIREEQEDRAADLRILERHILSAEQAVDGVDARIRALEAAAASAHEPNSALADMFDQKLAQLQKERAEQDKVIAALKEELAGLPKEIPEIPPAFDPAVLKPLESRIAELEKRPVAVPEEKPKVEAEAVPEPTAKEEPAEPEPKEPDEAPAPQKTPTKPKKSKSVSQIERPKRSTRERHKPEESRLLKRAISEKQDSSSTAVTRIIESKAKEEEPPAEPVSPAPASPPVAEKKSAETAAAKPVEKKAEPKAEPKADVKPAAGAEKEAPAAAPKKKAQPAAKKEEPAAEPPPAQKAEPAVAKKEAPVKAEKPKAKEETIDLEAEVPALDSSDMLFEDAAVSSPIKKTRAKKNDAVLTASVFIGIGNKPFLRGSGGGLNWDKGLAMEFQEIGKWRWVAPSDIEEPVELQLYRNDEDPDKSGKYTLKPGQKLEVSPVF